MAVGAPAEEGHADAPVGEPLLAFLAGDRLPFVGGDNDFDQRQVNEVAQGPAAAASKASAKRAHAIGVMAGRY